MELAGRKPPEEADLPIDDVDLENLARLRRLQDALDPMPDDLVEGVRFALELEHLDAEVAKLVETSAEGVRSHAGTAEQARTIIFESSTVTVMVSVTVLDEDWVRVDGWLSPEGEYRVELRTPKDQVRTTSDVMGRFVVERLPRGIFRLVLKAPKSRHGNSPVVITPSVVID
ncbi:hypothetical protein FB566_1319 [Stackebrandtia endophytica]|uniref:Carboxypeptidase regulatory-like domain-containing protein n=1 Tax=Stackebrandtia endophytica TaxID=1496996 RepID=A0A543AT81_9ACTN|nr:hypothetical protein [Stackebrandtia endophytica]TQL75804.1 hypothetical protein FB566_1319 [Stackebrandtia endophytica]